MHLNTLRRIVAIQEITLKEKENGLTQREIYRRFIRGRYYISMSTYQRYLCVNARRMLRETFNSALCDDNEKTGS